MRENWQANFKKLMGTHPTVSDTIKHAEADALDIEKLTRLFIAIESSLFNEEQVGRNIPANALKGLDDPNEDQQQRNDTTYAFLWLYLAFFSNYSQRHLEKYFPEDPVFKSVSEMIAALNQPTLDRVKQLSDAVTEEEQPSEALVNAGKALQRKNLEINREKAFSAGGLSQNAFDSILEVARQELSPSYGESQNTLSRQAILPNSIPSLYKQDSHLENSPGAMRILVGYALIGLFLGSGAAISVLVGTRPEASVLLGLGCCGLFFVIPMSRHEAKTPLIRQEKEAGICYQSRQNAEFANSAICNTILEYGKSDQAESQGHTTRDYNTQDSSRFFTSGNTTTAGLIATADHLSCEKSTPPSCTIKQPQRS